MTMKNDALEQHRAPPNTLKKEIVERFLKEITKHPILGKRFQTMDKKKASYLARHICAALNYSFKYDRVTSFKQLIKIHRMMAITKEEVDAFNEVFINKCFSRRLPELSVQRRVLARVGKLIVKGYSNDIECEEVLFLYRALRKNTLLCPKFENANLADIHQILMKIKTLLKPGTTDEQIADLSKYQSLGITGAEFDEFTKLYLQIHDSKIDFIERVKPIIVKIKGYVVNEKVTIMKKLHHEIRMNPILGYHLRTMLFESLIKMFETILKFVEDPKYIEHIDEIVDFHRGLCLRGEEVDELERIFLRMFTQEDRCVVKFKEVMSQFKMRLLTNKKTE